MAENRKLSYWGGKPWTGIRFIPLKSVAGKTVLASDGKADFTQLELELMDSRHILRGNEKRPTWLKPSCIPITIILIFLALVVLFPLLSKEETLTESSLGLLQLEVCFDDCRFTFVESIPEHLDYPEGSPMYLSTFDGWINLISLAEKTIDIASMYWTLRGKDIYVDPSDWQGEKIYAELLKAGTQRNIKIRIAQDEPKASQPQYDTQDLESLGAAEVRSLDFPALLGGGILHTKMWLVDNKHFYVGSANTDWRSLTQVKELGVIIYNCSCLAKDMSKIFDVYWYLGGTNSSIPHPWPKEYATKYNKTTPLIVSFNDTNSTTYLASSPPPLCPEGRTSDIDAILDAIEKAREFVYIAVMDYSPTIYFSYPKRWWSVIDDKLRQVALDHHITIRILASKWNHSHPEMVNFLHSLQSLNGVWGIKIEAKLFEVPTFTEAEAKIPYARVNHNKYMVTDNAVYIGTSNWSGDYFVFTGGVSLIISQIGLNGTLISDEQPIREQLEAIFERDWNSRYASPASHFLEKQTSENRG